MDLLHSSDFYIHKIDCCFCPDEKRERISSYGHCWVYPKITHYLGEYTGDPKFITLSESVIHFDMFWDFSIF